MNSKFDQLHTLLLTEMLCRDCSCHFEPLELNSDGICKNCEDYNVLVDAAMDYANKMFPGVAVYHLYNNGTGVALVSVRTKPESSYVNAYYDYDKNHNRIIKFSTEDNRPFGNVKPLLSPETKDTFKDLLEAKSPNERRFKSCVVCGREDIVNWYGMCGTCDAIRTLRCANEEKCEEIFPGIGYKSGHRTGRDTTTSKIFTKPEPSFITTYYTSENGEIKHKVVDNRLGAQTSARLNPEIRDTFDDLLSDV